MLVIQILIDLFVLYAIFRVGLRIKDRTITFGWGVLWLAFWFAVGIVVSIPQTTSILAAKFGVTRGVDLVIYLSVIALFWLFFRTMVKIEKLERTITTLVREIALTKSKDIKE